MILNMYSYIFVHTLYCMGFQWFLSEEVREEVMGDDETVSTRCEPPIVLRPGCCCYICKR